MSSSYHSQDLSDSIENSGDDGFSELRDIIDEMGYSIENDELRELEKDLRLLEENADISDTRLFSCFLGGHDGSADLLFDQSLMHLFSDLASPIPKNQKPSDKLPPGFQELLNYGEERLKEISEDIKRYERLIEEGEMNPEESRQQEGVQESVQQQQEPSPLRTEVINQEKENNRPEQTRKAALDPKEETKLINQFLRANALRPIQCPEPGRAPFKHCQQLKLQQYRSEWEKQPPPGEQKRLALRWKIRELMLRRDIPQLRLVEEERNNNEDLLIMGPSNESRFNKPKRPKNADYSVNDEMRGVGVEGNSSNTTENPLDGEKEPFSFLAMMGRAPQVGDDTSLQAKTEIGNISLYGGSEKCSPSFFVDENTEFVKKSVQAFCRKNSKEEIYANFNRNRGAVINFYKSEKKAAMKNKRNRQKEDNNSSSTNEKIKLEQSEGQNE
uniref:Centriolar and ciliogenesis-associated protein HYLS1 C-terminal domain-containing protein n=4 Tax=Meloidogyne TaxID=189290 RepID=A0A915PFX9_9BILA